MFCTNCGAKLPDNAKFCPNCGAVITDHGTPLTEAVHEAEETAAAAQAVPEFLRDAAENAAETVKAAAEAVPEVIENAAGFASETVQEAVNTAFADAGEAVSAVAEAIQPVTEELKDMPLTETVPEIIPEIIPELTAEPVSEAAFTMPQTAPVQLQESVPYTPYVQPQTQTQPEVPQPPVQPYTGAPAAPIQNAVKNAGKKKGKGLLAGLLAVVVLAGAFLVYWNLPDTKYGRYTKQAVSAVENADYETAVDFYRKALEVRPDDDNVLSALNDLYDDVQYRAVEAVYDSRYEDAVNDVKLMAYILPEQTENNEYAMYDVYRSWVNEEAQKGNFDVVQTVLSRADADLTPEYSDLVNDLAVNIREMLTIEETLRGSVDSITQFNSAKDYKGVFSTLISNLDLLKKYYDLGGELPFAVPGSGSTGVMFYYDEGRDAAQLYIGGIADGNSESGYADTYYVSNASTSSRQYEYFSAENWSGGRPNGKFTEINFRSEPETPTDSNSDTVTGVLNEGKYEGEIANRRNGKTYYMKFDYGKVQVLDTVDPNGDSGNVVGYTSDKNSWITFRDSGLTGSYGVRYLT
jgi:tetratricopeptide (TPR) repeat protein